MDKRLNNGIVVIHRDANSLFEDQFSLLNPASIFVAVIGSEGIAELELGIITTLVRLDFLALFVIASPDAFFNSMP